MAIKRVDQPALPLRILHGAEGFLRDVLHGFLRILRWCGRIITAPFALHKREAEQIYADWKSVRDEKKSKQILKMSSSVLRAFFSDNGVFVTLLRYGLPIVCCGFLCSLVTYGASMDYGVAVSMGGTVIGYVENEADYRRAEEIVRERLSYAESPPEVDFTRKLSVVPYDGTERLLTAGGLADKIMEQADIALCTGYGVYRNDKFLGAVADTKPIEAALSEQLAAYSKSLDFAVDDIFYSDEMTYVKGVYLEENLTDADKIVTQLTAVSEGTGIYTSAKGDTVYRIAERYSISVEQLRAMNPHIKDMPEIGTKITVPTQERSMPITFTRTKETVSFLAYDTVRTDSAKLPIGKEEIAQRGVKGKKNNVVCVTYVNGVETQSKLIRSELVSEPVTEEISVGTYAPAPASKTTILYGTGEYGWPVNGGRISDVFISNRNHRGLDIAAPAGSEIYAADDGIVTHTAWSDSYGNYVIIDHGDGRETLYAHSSLLLTSVGVEVKRGDVIALVGTTGHSTGNHLHFEVRIDGVNYDPASFLRVNAD